MGELGSRQSTTLLWAPHSLSVHSPCWLQLEGPQSSSLQASPRQKWLVHSQWPSTQVPWPLQLGGWQRGSCTHTTVETRRGQRHMLSWLWGIGCEKRPRPWCWSLLQPIKAVSVCLPLDSDSHMCVCVCVHVRACVCVCACIWSQDNLRYLPFKTFLFISLWSRPCQKVD